MPRIVVLPGRTWHSGPDPKTPCCRGFLPHILRAMTPTIPADARSAADLFALPHGSPRARYLFFWVHQKSRSGVSASCLSQWWEVPFTVDGATYFEQAAWEDARYGILVEGNVAKFSQNPELAQFLVGTGARGLVETSPRPGSGTSE